MRVARLKMSGFRGVLSADITLGQHAVLVGPNNSGKTTVIEALALVFGRDRLVRRLTEHDFHGSSPDATSRIIVIATVTGFPQNDPEHSPAWFGMDRGVEKWLGPKTKTLSAKKDPQHTDLDLSRKDPFSVAFLSRAATLNHSTVARVLLADGDGVEFA